MLTKLHRMLCGGNKRGKFSFLYLKGYGYSQLIFFHKTYHSKHALMKRRVIIFLIFNGTRLGKTSWYYIRYFF